MRIATHERLHAIVTALMAVGIALALMLGGAAFEVQAAYASVYPDSTAAAATQEDDQSDEATSDEAASAEEIDDEDVPMAAGLGGGEPVFSTGVGIHWAIIAGIAAVVAYFVVSMLRVNKNISDMRQRLRHR